MFQQGLGVHRVEPVKRVRSDRRIPSGRALGLVSLLGAAMVTATYQQGALSVLSSFVIEEFTITRGELGIVFTAFSLTGAAVSPFVGGLVDTGPRKVMLGLFGVGAIGLLIAAGAPSYPILLGGAILGGLGLGAGNPVTNRVIAQRISAARRGLVVGLKQAGPPLGLLVSGLLLPPLAALFGWRIALAVSAILPVLGLIATPYFIPSESGRKRSTESTAQPGTRAVVIWLTVIGLAAAMALGALIAFLPLYAQEAVGQTAATGGILAAFLGLVGVVSRIAWGNVATRFNRPTTALIIITVASIVGVGAIALASAYGPAFVWLGTFGVGISVQAWHSVAWVVIIDRVGIHGLGRASGIMQLGNGVGFASGPPAVGALIDATGSYTPGWVLVGTLLLVALILTIRLRIKAPSRAASSK
ncbi:MAG: MFS transporter [Acidimicrobiia bacterium]|nr:MFS transporter [Acidimicrobiia bacterium]